MDSTSDHPLNIFGLLDSFATEPALRGRRRGKEEVRRRRGGGATTRDVSSLSSSRSFPPSGARSRSLFALSSVPSPSFFVGPCTGAQASHFSELKKAALCETIAYTLREEEEEQEPVPWMDYVLQPVLQTRRAGPSGDQFPGAAKEIGRASRP